MEPFRAADHVAQELSTPQLAQQAMQEIRNDLYQMRPGEALAFAHRLNQDLGGRSPLHERPEIVPGPNGQPIRTGGEVLTMSDPFRPGAPEQVVKQIRREFMGQPGYAGQPGYIQPGYGQPGYIQPGYGQPGYIYPGQNPAVTGLELGAGAAVGSAIIRGIIGDHRR